MEVGADGSEKVFSFLETFFIFLFGYAFLQVMTLYFAKMWFIIGNRTTPFREFFNLETMGITNIIKVKIIIILEEGTFTDQRFT